MENADFIRRRRNFVNILQELSSEFDISITVFSHEWIIRLEKRGIVKYVFGYNFELNTSAAQMIANDKSAVSDLLQYYGIPHVEHKLFLNPRLHNYVSDLGNWDSIVSFASEHDFRVVCKPNKGTNGRGVIRVETQRELERAVEQLFQNNRAICIAPYHSITQEYRLILIGNNCELAYKKILPTIVGDGVSNVATLISDQIASGKISDKASSSIYKHNFRLLSTTPENGCEIRLNWKHNLGQGATPLVLDDLALFPELKNLAVSCAKRLNLSFVSVDLIETQDKLMVLEVNTGIMLESFSAYSQLGYLRAKDVYRKALEYMFSNEP